MCGGKERGKMSTAEKLKDTCRNNVIRTHETDQNRVTRAKTQWSTSLEGEKLHSKWPSLDAKGGFPENRGTG